MPTMERIQWFQKVIKGLVVPRGKKYPKARMRKSRGILSPSQRPPTPKKE